jgi:hypothetical protein
MGVKEMGYGRRLDSSASEQGPLTNCCESDNVLATP